VRVIASRHASSLVGVPPGGRDRLHKSTKLHKGPLAT
jgi:hypothetical protein